MSRSSRKADEEDNVLLLELRLAEERLPLHPLNKMTWSVPDGPSLRAAQLEFDLFRRRLVPEAEADLLTPSPGSWTLVWPSIDTRSDDELRRTQKPSSRLLLTFANLADAKAERFQEFARRYGPLGLCQDNLPHTHSRSAERPGVDGSPERYGCAPIPEEHVSIWRQFAQMAKSMIHIVADLDRGAPVPMDRWRPLAPLVLTEPIEASVPDDGDIFPGSPPRSSTEHYRRTLVTEQRRFIAHFIDQWLGLAGIEPRFWWQPGRRGLDLVGPGGLFAALAVQLADTATQQDLHARCDNCHQLFKPTRRPAAGRDCFCARQECKEARKKRYRRRRAEEVNAEELR